MKYFIDSNIFLRILVKTDAKMYSDAFKFLQLIEENKIEAVSSSLVLAEIVWVLGSVYGYRRREINTLVTSILNFKDIKWFDEYNSRLALELYTKNKVKFIDAMLASQKSIQNKQWIVVSYDKDFAKLMVLRCKPDEVMIT